MSLIRAINRPFTRDAICAVALVIVVILFASPCLADEGCLQETGRCPFGSVSAMAVFWPYFLYGTGTALAVADLRDPWVVDQDQLVDLGLPVTDIQIAESYAYVITAAGLHILEYKTAGPPSVVGFAAIDDEALSVAVHGWWAFVLARQGYGVVHIGDPTSPQMMNFGFSPYVQFEAMAFEYPHAYIVGKGGIKIIDVSSPAIPVRVGEHERTGDEIAVAGGFVFVVSEYDLHLLDVHDPSDPNLRSSIRVGGGTSDVVASWPYVYVSYRGGLDIFNVSSLDDPQTIGMWRVYPEKMKALVLDNERVHLAGEGGIYVVDVSDPEKPIEITKWAFFSGQHIALSGSQALIAGYSSVDVNLVDLRDPAAPIVVGSWRPLPSYGIEDVAFSNGNAVVKVPGGLFILDLTDPSAPKQISYLEMIGMGDMGVDGNFAYTSSVAAGGFCIFQVVDISNPSVPRERGSISQGRWCPSAAAIVAAEGRVLVADSDGLRIIDATDPWNPFETARWDQTGANGVALVGDIGLMTFASYDDPYDTGLAVIDVSDLTSPVVLNVWNWNAPSAAKSVAVIGGSALVTTADAGTFLIDLSNPSIPTVIGEVSHPLKDGGNVASFGLNAIVTHGESGITALKFKGSCLPPRRPQGRTGVQHIFDTASSP